MVYYINNFKSLDGLIEKRNELIINIFKLIKPVDVKVNKEYINNEWRLKITVIT